ncbi:MAG: tetratricopeptide repeat protein [Acidobacteria bacterium]|nr:tetratricopeptide repeat protein [Acidobacteriota bacterium]
MITDVLRARRIFSEIASLEESVFPLDRAALAIPLEDYPNLNIEDYTRQLDRMAVSAEVLLGSDRTPPSVLESLNEVLFVREGLRGNTEDYYDPRNSLLNEVLDRKLGIPISLSVIYMETARRIGLALQGVGFPGHFIVKYEDTSHQILIDPFNQGRLLTEGQCQELLDRVYGGSVQVQPAFLQPMSKREIVTRMLFNLKGIYYQKEDYRRALTIVERILMLNPGTPSEVRDRGLLFMQTSLFARALSDLEYYLSIATAPPDEAFVRSHIRLLRRIVSCTN